MRLVAGPQVQVIGVAQNDFGARLLEVLEEHAFYRSLRPDGHERGGTDTAVRRVEFAEPGGCRRYTTTRSGTGCSRRLLWFTGREVHGSMGSHSTKLRVGVIYGGRSGEHEVSIVSAASIFKHLDRSRYEPVPIRIDKDGRWVLGGKEPTAISAGDIQDSGSAGALQVTEPTAAITGGIDVVFPVLHGPYGEDGTVQGLLELANVPYVGAGVLGSALGMDKAISKTVFAAHGLPIVPYLTVTAREWEIAPKSVAARVGDSLHYPVFVKPANLGSSVGISRAQSDGDLAQAIEAALEYDRKLVIESGVPDAREIECAVLGNDEPEASLPGEIVVTHPDGFYSYEAKYLDPERSHAKDPGRPAGGHHRPRPPPQRRGIPCSRSRRHGARRLLPRRPRRRALFERSQYDSGIHCHLDVSEDVGGHRRVVPGAAQPTADAGDRAPRAETAAPHVTSVSTFQRSSVFPVTLCVAIEREGVASRSSSDT